MHTAVKPAYALAAVAMRLCLHDNHELSSCHWHRSRTVSVVVPTPTNPANHWPQRPSRRRRFQSPKSAEVLLRLTACVYKTAGRRVSWTSSIRRSSSSWPLSTAIVGAAGAGTARLNPCTMTWTPRCSVRLRVTAPGKDGVAAAAVVPHSCPRVTLLTGQPMW